MSPRLLLACALAPLGLAAAAPKPNFVFLLVDDQGWTDVSGLNPYSSRFYKMPATEALSRECMNFTRAYAEPVCSPTRADLLTGKYPTRHHIYTVTNPGDSPSRQLGRRENSDSLSRDIPTLAEVLTKEGYTCASIGKWHLGKHGTPTGPLGRGFAVNIGGSTPGMPPGGGKKSGKGGGYWAADDGSFPLLPNLPANGKPGQHLTDRLTDEALKFLDSAKAKPFFLYLPHYGVHAGHQSSEEDQAPYKNAKPDPAHPGHKSAVYGGMLAGIDRSVKTLVAYLKSTDDPRNPGARLIDNTVFVYMSDNGGASGTDNLPLREAKATPYEGGVRVPMFIYHKGRKGVTDTPVHAVDFFPTFLELAGVKPDPANPADGASLVPLLAGTGTLAPRGIFRHQPVHVSGSPSSTITKGDYKLILHYETPNSKTYKGHGWYELFNLASDISEKRNLVDAVDLAKPDPVKQVADPKVRAVFSELAGELNRWLIATKAELPYEGGTKREVKLPDIR